MASYLDLYNEYAKKLTTGTNSANEALKKAYDNNAAKVNNAYNDSARNLYQNYRVQEANLPEQLSRLGVTGGASETSQLKLLNNYGGNLNSNELARNQEANALSAGYNNQVAQNNISLQGELADKYAQMYLAQMEADEAERQRRAVASSRYGGSSSSSSSSSSNSYADGLANSALNKVGNVVSGLAGTSSSSSAAKSNSNNYNKILQEARGRIKSGSSTGISNIANATAYLAKQAKSGKISQSEYKSIKKALGL